ncbi:hypothetical protein MPTK1_2g00340 [Marchantia polymorpha subsp. ruderalis]|uniref:Uncharacterized protein n=1 Tax=Marchantia polymorpha TaxID=3197 RepID=A0A2R6X9Q4_MARPO|nr:hypothetical protein MARPO_0028s0117 [Marchantia polymorpha]BBN00573.1 hypothetical protein Mp_2g00340 [Marchantia polymorpha subsp. ruderalis]|eukprot:PTQ42824.1 hypothetical protein MARPO_0028s0117 [Marchantia polymorpha]
MAGGGRAGGGRGRRLNLRLTAGRNENPRRGHTGQLSVGANRGRWEGEGSIHNYKPRRYGRRRRAKSRAGPVRRRGLMGGDPGRAPARREPRAVAAAAQFGSGKIGKGRTRRGSVTTVRSVHRTEKVEAVELELEEGDNSGGSGKEMGLRASQEEGKESEGCKPCALRACAARALMLPSSHACACAAPPPGPPCLPPERAFPLVWNALPDSPRHHSPLRSDPRHEPTRTDREGEPEQEPSPDPNPEG